MTLAMAENTLELLGDALQALADAQIQTWLFGGWAEELSGLRPPGPHRDIDLLYPAQDFGRLDAFLQTQSDAEGIQAKRFTHKRAFEWHGVRVEVFLTHFEAEMHITDFFGTYRFEWPPDTLTHSVRLPCGECPSASPAALCLYRQRHADVETAHRHFLARPEAT